MSHPDGSASLATDIAWQREITLRFAPHAVFDARKAVEFDYGMTNGFAEITTRVRMPHCWERQFGLDR